jgi:hypothetical protein
MWVIYSSYSNVCNWPIQRSAQDFLKANVGHQKLIGSIRWWANPMPLAEVLYTNFGLSLANIVNGGSIFHEIKLACINIQVFSYRPSNGPKL